MNEAAPPPTGDDVRGWTAEQRASVARLLAGYVDGLATGRSPRRRVLVLTLGSVGALFMLPWLAYLFVTLPAYASGGAWRTAWIGFDIALAVAFGATAVTVWARRQVAVVALLITATLLTCDAWFDVCLSWGTSEHWASVASAGAELPIAAVMVSSAGKLLRRSCIVVAHLRGQDPTQVPLWRQPMIHHGAAWSNAASTTHLADRVRRRGR